MKSLAFGKVRNKEIYVFVSAAKIAPSDEDWDAYVEFLRTNTKPGTQTYSIVYTRAPAPTALQRWRLSEVVEKLGKSLRIALLTDSAMARGVVLALSWMGGKTMAFRPDQIKEATAALGLPEADGVQAASLVNVLKQQVDG